MGKEERLKDLQAKRNGLDEEYKRLSMRLSDLQDLISDVEGDIRMIEYELQKKPSRRV